jgi:predicted dehydrogenase
MTPTVVRVGVVGYGVMGRMHSYAFRAASQVRPLPVRFEPVVISGRNARAVQRAAEDFGIDEWVTDWRAVVERTDVDVVDVCTPPGMHSIVAVAAAANGKSVICEKPLAQSFEAADEAFRAVQRAGVHHAVGFNYRHLPAVALLEQMVAAGEIGEVRLWRGSWLTDEFVDPNIPFDWRFDVGMGGTTIADLGSHLVDLAELIAGPVAAVSATSTTFVGQRADSGGTRRVEVDDASSALLQFESGAQGTLEVVRAAPRRPCDFTLEVNGSTGTLIFSYHRLNELWYGDAREDPRLYGLRRIRVEHPTQPETAGWWPIGQGIGYDASFVNQFAALAESWPDEPWCPGFDVGVRVAAVCEAMEIAAREHRWVRVAEVAEQPETRR